MADVQLDAVLQFFRKNGLSECESALMEDIVDKSSNFDKFCFPPPPPLRITATRRPQFIDGRSQCSSDDDEFVSVDSSTSGIKV